MFWHCVNKKMGKKHKILAGFLPLSRGQVYPCGSRGSDDNPAKLTGEFGSAGILADKTKFAFIA